MMKHTAANIWRCLIFTWILYRANGKSQDTHVHCQYSKDCVLPCTFTPSGEEEIQWFRHDILVYTHPHRTKKLLDERMSIAVVELTVGNASLLLQRCLLSDRGRYRCQVTRGEKSDNFYMILKVEAPIRLVNLEITRLSGYEEVKCSTYDVYPAPRVFWSTDPPTPTGQLKYTTRKMADMEGLYIMESKLKRLVQRNDLTYICMVNSSSSVLWMASLTETVYNNVTFTSKLFSVSSWTEITSAEGQDIIIPCRSPWMLQNFTLTWTFTRANMSTVICTYNSETQLISNHWNTTVRLDLQSLQQGDGSLQLLTAQSTDHMGMYTCNISALQRNHVGETWVNITALQPENENMRMLSSRPWWIPITLLIIVIVAATAGILKLQHKFSQRKTSGRAKYSKDVKVSVNTSEETTEGNVLTSDQSPEHT